MLLTYGAEFDSRREDRLKKFFLSIGSIFLSLHIFINMKEEILKLRSEGKTYNQIKEILGCSKSTISYHCNNCKKTKIKNISKNIYRVKVITCLKCGKEIKTRNHQFCSIYCSNTYRTKERVETEKEKNKRLEKEYYQAKFKGVTGDKFLEKIKEDKILNAEFNTLKFDNLRMRVILEQDKKCFNCGLDKWLECDLVLELEHKDGNNKNNQRDNLIALCPNCHSLTKTWRGRNISDKNKTVKLTSQDYIEAYKRNNGNIRKALLDLNIAAKGGNYKIMYKHLDSFNIPYVKRNKSL